MAEGNTPRPLGLLLDDPADTDLLSFDAVAGTIVEALFDPKLDPIALGLTGSWGSGKTTILRLIRTAIQIRESKARNGRALKDGDPRTLIVLTDPWRYDPQVGAKESLIAEVLDALDRELQQSASPTDAIKKRLSGLVKRVNWNKAFSMAAKGALALQLPSVDELLKLVDPPDGGDGAPVTRMDDFRDQFEDVVNSPEFAHVTNVVVLVDDLDRCLPETVIETLEAIRLFLSVKKMSFVIAADEDRIAEAIAERFKGVGHTPTPSAPRGRVRAASGDEESPARLYLHKIVQTSVPVPSLSDFDTQVFLALLRVQQQTDPEAFADLVGRVTQARLKGRGVDDIDGSKIDAWVEESNFAARITPIIHEKSRGNPRRIKRFLNDLAVRMSIAGRRGIALDSAKIAKLMILETYSVEDFGLLLQWQASNELRDRLREIETQTGLREVISTRSDAEQAVGEPRDATRESGTIKNRSLEAAATPTSARSTAKTSGRRDSDDKTRRNNPAKGTPEERDHEAASSAGDEGDSGYRPSEFMLRWGRLSPPLADTDIRPYLILAASFTDEMYFETKGLPEHLREPAQFLGSANLGERRLISDAMIDAFGQGEVEQLVRHLGQMARDQPDRQVSALTGVIRLIRRRPAAARVGGQVIGRLSAEELKPGVPLLFDATDDPIVLDAVRRLAADAPSDVQKALEVALTSGGSNQ